MNRDIVWAVLRLLMWVLPQWPAMSAAVQRIIDHEQPWTDAEAAAFRAEMEEAFSRPEWQPEGEP